MVTTTPCQPWMFENVTEEGAEKVDKTLVEHQSLIPPGDGGRCGYDDWGGGNIDDD